MRPAIQIAALTLILISLLTVPISAQAESKDANEVFHRIDRVADLPKEARDKIGNMANPREKWQEGCVGGVPALPIKRLIFAARSDRRLIVHYEQGGRAHSYMYAVFSIENGKTVYKGAALLPSDLRKMKELKENQK